ncbi:hypothetical protein B0H10DRAFT_2166370 [Mycena sp. CBHHK59/15]|nr:hypothetical protein B0H10DRAFT_2166370 [Mycena sp. CBHHK59/15]
MPRYQSEIALSLAVSAVCSVVFYLNITGEGKIQLPVPNDGIEKIYPDGYPFDVTTAEDLLDGYPSDEAKFWAQMRRRKFFLCFIFSLSVLAQVVCLVLGDLTLYALQTLFALYLLSVAAFSVRRQTVDPHAESVWHLTSLTSLAVVSMVFTSILPTEDSPVIAVVESVLSSLRYTVLALYIIAFITSVTTPRAITNKDKHNVAGIYSASPLSVVFFLYCTKVVMLGNTAESLEIGDLPILTLDMRASFHYTAMKRVIRTFKLSVGNGMSLAYQLTRVNKSGLTPLVLLSVSAGMVFYMPPFFLSMVLNYLENDPEREHTGWGWVWVCFLFLSNVVLFMRQLWSLSTSTMQARVRTQLNTILFATTLVRKDIASSAASLSSSTNAPVPEGEAEKKPEENEFSSKAQIMTLMTTDVDRVEYFSRQIFTIIDAPIELVVGTLFLYKLLGVSCFFGLGMAILCLPLKNYAGKIVVGAQDGLMKSRDERVVLMNEFMAWERSFEKRVVKIRAGELRYQRLNYTIEVRDLLFMPSLWNATPVLVTLVSFYHFAVIRGQNLTPAIAFTSVLFNELKFALSALPETFISMLQYLNTPEVTPVPPMERQAQTIAFQSCTVTWPQDNSSTSAAPSTASTPRYKFVLVDLSLKLPPGELSLICGKLGSEDAFTSSGQVMCPRSPPDSLASFAGLHPTNEEWVVEGICAYVPQVGIVHINSYTDNILFNLPYDEVRYKKTLVACALVTDLEILEDGDNSEIGDLSGGQKARVSLARAIYSHASILLLDDVLSAVDAHTHHLYHSCLRGELMQGRTVILVSHHVQLCATGAGYVVALDNGRVQFQGSRGDFQTSGVMSGLVQSITGETQDEREEAAIDELKLTEGKDGASAESSDAVAPAEVAVVEKKVPRKFFEDEQRAVGRVAWSVWTAYIFACGPAWYWVLFGFFFMIAALAPLMENRWLSFWSRGDGSRSPLFFLTVYAAVSLAFRKALLVVILHSDNGSIRASTVLYKNLLQAVLFAHIRIHDTVSRGRLVNRFGKDFEGIDINLSDNFGKSAIYFISTITTVTTIRFIGGPPFVAAVVIYGQACRDMRRLGTRSPLYSMYAETIAGVAIVLDVGHQPLALGEAVQFATPDILICAPAQIRMMCLSSIITALTALLAVLNKSISAPLAGFALAIANTLTYDLLLLVREFVSLEQAMRIKEYSDLPKEAPEFGAIACEGLSIRYAPDLPDVLDVCPGEKVSIRSGKSTLALSFFRFVEPAAGRIVVNGVDFASVGLTDLRSRLTIIPQDPTILSGTLRSTLDVFDEYEDSEIFAALRRVHLIPDAEAPPEAVDAVNANVFRNLEAPVSEGGENCSTGEKQLLCMARAVLKRSKVLVMDEVVDYATDELIGKTIRDEFKESTILTIAHRLRTIMLLDQGRITEFDRPASLIADQTSKFHALCRAAGRQEFAVLKRMVGV